MMDESRLLDELPHDGTPCVPVSFNRSNGKWAYVVNKYVRLDDLMSTPYTTSGGEPMNVPDDHIAVMREPKP